MLVSGLHCRIGNVSYLTVCGPHDLAKERLCLPGRQHEKSPITAKDGNLLQLPFKNVWMLNRLQLTLSCRGNILEECLRASTMVG